MDNPAHIIDAIRKRHTGPKSTSCVFCKKGLCDTFLLLAAIDERSPLNQDAASTSEP